jgi:hypothetical protein
MVVAALNLKSEKDGARTNFEADSLGNYYFFIRGMPNQLNGLQQMICQGSVS